MSTTAAVTRARWYRPGSVMKAGTAEPSAAEASLSCGDPFSAEARTVPAIAARMERASLPALCARGPSVAGVPVTPPGWGAMGLSGGQRGPWA